MGKRFIMVRLNFKCIIILCYVFIEDVKEVREWKMDIKILRFGKGSEDDG